MKKIITWSFIAALLASSAVTSTLPAVAAEPSKATMVENFDSINAWQSTAGNVQLSASKDKTEGSGSVQVSYDVSASQAYIGTKTTTPVIASNLYSQLSVDIKGDGTYNTVYALMTDASGEVYYYRVDAMGFTGWKTITVDLTQPPTAVGYGNKNNVLDAPLTLNNFIVERNGNQPAKSVFNIDNVKMVGDGWTTPEAKNSTGRKNFVPSNGEKTTISFKAATAGDYNLTLKDDAGFVKTFTGKVAKPQTVSLSWNGKNEAGKTAAGNINATLSYDKTVDGKVTTPSTVGGNAFLTGIAARQPSGTNSPVGVNGSIVYDDMPAANVQAQLMEEAYVNYVREEFDWKNVEPRNNYYTWGQTDRLVAVSNARNLNLIGRLQFSPAWATTAPAGTSEAELGFYPPTNLDDFADYVTSTVHRYKDSVHTWEVWNEVNTSFYWKPAPDSAAFAEMMKVAYKAIKAEDPTATVIAGGLAGFDYDYMEGFRKAGAMQSFDALGVHTFVNGSFDSSMSDTWLDGAEAYLAKYAPNAKIFITELAWSSCVNGSSDCEYGVSEKQQAEYLQQAYLDAASRGVTGITWWNLIEYGDSNSSLDNMGLIQKDGKKKEGYTALKSVGKALYNSNVIGNAAPTIGGSEVLVDGFDATSKWQTAMLNGGQARLTSVDGRHATKAGGLLEYDFSGNSTGVELKTNQKLTGQPTALSLWIYGDNSNNPVYLRFKDAKGEQFQALIGNSGTQKWKRATFYLDGDMQDYQHGNGNNNNKVEYPITVEAVVVYKSLVTKQATGEIHIDDLTAHYGTTTRGVVLNGENKITQALYSPKTGSGVISLTDSKLVTLSTNTGTVNRIPVFDKTAVQLSPSPTYVSSTLGVSLVKSSVKSSVTLKWQAADRVNAVTQVYTKDGLYVRTLQDAGDYDAAIYSVKWDSRKDSGELVSPGEYKFRVTFRNTDGSLSFIEEGFTKTK